MAALAERLAINVPGRFYVDVQCIFCDFCVEIAPAVFKEDKASGFAYVYRQPTSEVERAAASHAVKMCPTESIGEDDA